MVRLPHWLMVYLNPFQLFAIIAGATVFGPLAYVFVDSLATGASYVSVIKQILPAVAFLTIFVAIPFEAFVLLSGKELGHESV